MAAALALCAAVYWPGLGGGFIFDDLPNLVQNHAWKIGSLTPTALSHVLESDISGALGRPLAMLSFAVNHVLTGPDPFALKLTNLLMHLLNGILVFFLCRQLLPRALGGVVPVDRGLVASALVASAWLLHPLQVSTVLYTVQRMEIGATSGVLACLVAYLAARRRHANQRPSAGWFALAGVMLLVGVGFKESAVLGLPLLLLADVVLLGFRDPTGRTMRGLLAFHGLWLVCALSAYALIVIPEVLQPAVYAARDFSLPQRLLSQGPVLLMYLGQILLPLPDAMLFYYDHLQAPESLLTPPSTAVSFLAIAAVVAFAAFSRRHWPLVAFGILWFFVCHALTSNVFPLELAFEHRNYLALLGPLLVGCAVLSRLTRGLNADAALSIGLAPTLALAGLCLIQASTWGEPLRLAAALAGRNPESPRANYDLGSQLYQVAQGDSDSPQWFLARRQFEVAARLPGASALPDQALLIMDSAGGAPFPADRWQALEQKLLATPLGPDNVSTLHSVVACRLASRCDLPDTAVLGLLERMEEKHPDAYVVSIIRANFIWNGIGDQEAAIAVLRNRRDRGNTSYHVDLALAEFLLASNLHEDWAEAASILSGLSSRELPPDAREKVRTLQTAMDGGTRKSKLQQ